MKGPPFQVRTGEVWRIAAEVWRLPDGGFAWCSPGWDTDDAGHSFHVHPGPAEVGEHGGVQVGDVELLALHEGDPDRPQWDAWVAYLEGEGSHATRQRAAEILNASGLLPEGVTV